MAEQQIDLGALSLQQLEGLKDQLEQELDQFAESFQQLQAAANRFHVSGVAAENLANETAGKATMIPLTSSLYVSGTLDSTDKLLVDVGTGYYVEKSPAESGDFCKRKVMMLKKNMEALHALIYEKRKQSNQVNQVFQLKLMRAQQQQQQQAQ